ncbi:hypothetical protein DSO57_1009333 [Entomophthora muscae]|uniref:Uncharacterized protein n=1 Tax=Entomophthora muscae TaxID=34485 RepID=A0ACC2RXY1_9FUNG|nr:hypothetical protein DSO57_1009333 [Entomophthora muscae]
MKSTQLILALLPLGSLALNRPLGPVIKYQLYDMNGNIMENQFVEEDVELKRRKASKDFRNFLNGTPSASFPYLPDTISDQLIRMLDDGMKVLLTATVNGQFAKVHSDPRDAAAIARMVGKYYEGDLKAIDDTFHFMDKSLSEDEETKMNTQAALKFLDGALNGDFMELSLDIMHGIKKVSPPVARVSIDNMKKLQAKHNLVNPNTFDKFIVRMGEH